MNIIKKNGSGSNVCYTRADRVIKSVIDTHARLKGTVPKCKFLSLVEIAGNGCLISTSQLRELYWEAPKPDSGANACQYATLVALRRYERDMRTIIRESKKSREVCGRA